MGGEGSMAFANQSLKQNRGLLRKRRFKDIKGLMKSHSKKTALEFKKIAPEELARIKTEIRLRAKKERKRAILIYALAVVIAIAIIFWGYKLLK